MKPYRQTPPFCGSHWLGDPKRARGQAKLCESGEQVLSGIGQLLFYQLHPPPPLAPQSHCTCSQATCSCRFNMTARLLIDSWSTGSCSSRAPALAMLSLIGSLAYLVQAPASVCRPRANLTALSCTRSPFPYRAALANRISTGHWMEQEIKEDPKNNNNKRRGRRTNSPFHRSSSKQSGGKTAHMHHTSFYTAQGCFQVWLHMHTDGSALRAEAGAILGVERARRLNAGQWSTVGCQNEILSLVHEESDFFW